MGIYFIIRSWPLWMYKEYMLIDAVKIAVKYSSDGYKESIHE